MNTAVDKAALIAQLQADIARDIATTAAAARDAHAAATHEESKPENDKDTRGLELSYLAAAQAERVREMERTSAALGSMELRAFVGGASIAASALVELAVDGTVQPLRYFMASAGGGLRTTLAVTSDPARARAEELVEIQVLTPQSPLGGELFGKEVGDVVELKVRGHLRAYEIVRVM